MHATKFTKIKSMAYLLFSTFLCVVMGCFGAWLPDFCASVSGAFYAQIQ